MNYEPISHEQLDLLLDATIPTSIDKDGATLPVKLSVLHRILLELNDRRRDDTVQLTEAGKAVLADMLTTPWTQTTITMRPEDFPLSTDMLGTPPKLPPGNSPRLGSSLLYLDEAE